MGFDVSQLIEYVTLNWQNISITIIVSTFFYFLSSISLKKIVISAEKERINQAKDSLLNILEARIINKQDVSLEKVNSLINAINRDHSLNLFQVVTPITLLQDLELIFEKSHHLDARQKDEYCTQIREQVKLIEKSIQNEGKIIEIPMEYSKILEKLSIEIESKDLSNAHDTLEVLKKKLSSKKKEDEIDFYGLKRKSIEVIPVFVAIFTAIISILDSLGVLINQSDIEYFIFMSFIILFISVSFLLFYKIKYQYKRDSVIK